MKVRPDVCQAILIRYASQITPPKRAKRGIGGTPKRSSEPVCAERTRCVDERFVVFAVWARRNGKWGDSRHNEAKRNERAIQAEPVQHYGFGYDIPQPKLT
ncbi:hypothetical protein L596_019175 [Steinernema carpocapsae]|uniref:Uncharacterized protein n=1 Tax=Steinernema carpocapsae TaxID=34508 RepID=A0A4U5N7P4_STECR|nr:hypothetical protein L596_019175 [Steinernema carpocapsae]